MFYTIYMCALEELSDILHLAEIQIMSGTNNLDAQEETEATQVFLRKFLLHAAYQ